MWMSHVTLMNVSFHLCECVMSHTRHVTHVNAACHTHERVLLHIRMRHVTHMNTSCHTYENIMPHIWMRHVTLAQRHTCDMTHLYVWRTHLYVWHDSFICVTWLIHTCDMTHHIWMCHLTRAQRYTTRRTWKNIPLWDTSTTQPQPPSWPSKNERKKLQRRQQVVKKKVFYLTFGREVGLAYDAGILWVLATL